MYAVSEQETSSVAFGFELLRSHLKTESCYVLHSLDEVYCWYGNHSSKVDKTTALQFAKTLSHAPIICRQATEPAIFKAKFSSWDLGIDLGTRKLRNPPPLESQAFRVRALTASGILPSRPAAFEHIRSVNDPHRSPTPTRFYPLPELQRFISTNNVPVTLEKDQIEQYLNEEDFEAAFSMTKNKFNSLPKWKQMNLKKSVDLF